MSDDSNPADAGEIDNNPAPAGEAQSGPARDTDNATAAELRILRKQLKDAQQRLSAADQAAADKAKAEMTELERYKTEAEQYRKQAEETNARFLETQKHNAFRLAATQAGAVDVNAALKLADLSTLDLDGDTVVGVDAAIKALKKSSPYLFGSTAAPASSGGGNPPSGAPTYTAEQISKLRGKDFDQFARDVRSGKIKL